MQNFVLDEDGCDQCLSRSEMMLHERNCSKGPIECPYSSECKLLRKEQLENHIKSCIHRPIPCQYCGLEFGSDLSSHVVECDMSQINCKFCEKTIVKREIQTHWNQECTENPHDCPYKAHGCGEASMNAKALTQHLSDKIENHMQLMNAFFENKLTHVQSQFEKILLQRDEQIEYLKKIRNRFCWDVDWSKVQKNKFITSKIFKLSKYNWNLGLWPYGDPSISDTSGYLSLYLFIDNPSPNHHVSDLTPSSLLLAFSFRIVNNRAPQLTQITSMQKSFPIPHVNGWGESKIIEFSKITQSSGFLTRDNILHIQCDINVIQKLYQI